MRLYALKIVKTIKWASNLISKRELLEGYSVDVAHERLFAQVTVKQAGFMYIYLSNDNPSPVEVYFDDFEVEQVKSAVIKTDDYYPFGLTFNSYQRENSVEQQWKFQGQEHLSDLGLNWDSFKWRNHQPDIGRFFSIDPLSESYYHNSAYAFSENKVVNGIDLEGLEYFNTTARVGFALKGDFKSLNHYVRVDRQRYELTKRWMTDIVEIARGYRDTDLSNKVYDTDVGFYYDNITAPKPAWSNVSGKSRIVPNPQYVIPETPGQRGFLGLGAVAVLATEAMDFISRMELKEDLNKTTEHGKIMMETWAIVSNAQKMGLLPQKLTWEIWLIWQTIF
jgi:RHS repeat-associated protein